MRVLFAASEAYPFVKTGGLADVVFALPRALRAHVDVTVVLPLYRWIDREGFGIVEQAGEAFDAVLGTQTHHVRLYETRYGGVRFLFVESPLLCERDYPYGPPGGAYADNAERFGLFSHAVARLAAGFDLVHLNDWQTALAALLLRQSGRTVRCVFTIHNLAYQGLFDASLLSTLGIDPSYFTMEGIEFYGQLSFMKAGIGCADAVTTVSPTYAEEILTPEYGCGLEGYLNRHRAKLSGILNGIDTAFFSPADDPALARTYDTVEGKAANKAAMLARFELAADDTRPLFVFIGRFTWQKGLDILLEALPEMLRSSCIVAVLGEGDPAYRLRLETLAERYENLYPIFGYDEALSHRLYAAADFLLMPSMFEPCGLNQMIAMRYGTLPLVRRTGGLADTVAPFEAFDADAATGYGICFEPPKSAALSDAFERALGLYAQKQRLEDIASHDMRCDFSWTKSAKQYARLYNVCQRSK